MGHSSWLDGRPIYVHRRHYRVHLTDVIALSIVAMVLWSAKVTWWLLVGVFLFYKWAAIMLYRACQTLHRRYLT